jgi:hypothetical protein
MIGPVLRACLLAGCLVLAAAGCGQELPRRAAPSDARVQTVLDSAGLPPDGSTGGSDKGTTGAADGPGSSHDGAAHPEGGGGADGAGGGGKCVTSGSGGPTQDLQAQSFTAQNGLKSSYHLYAANLDWSKTVGLAVILHGDGGGFYQNPQWGADDMIKILHAENMLTINVLTPDSSTKTWWKDGDNNDEFLADLIDEEVLKRYAVDTDRVLIIGYSGGADFTTLYFIPGHGEKYCGGGAILYGCGSPPWKNLQFSAEFIKSFKLHFYAGQDDQYLSNAQKGAKKYTDLGFTVTSEWPSGINHTNIPFGKVLQDQLAKGLLSH